MRITREIKHIGGTSFEYSLCPRCGVWVLSIQFNHGTGYHDGCAEYLKGRRVREAAEKRVIG